MKTTHLIGIILALLLAGTCRSQTPPSGTPANFVFVPVSGAWGGGFWQAPTPVPTPYPTPNPAWGAPAGFVPITNSYGQVLYYSNPNQLNPTPTPTPNPAWATQPATTPAPTPTPVPPSSYSNPVPTSSPTIVQPIPTPTPTPRPTPTPTPTPFPMITAPSNLAQVSSWQLVLGLKTTPIPTLPPRGGVR